MSEFDIVIEEMGKGLITHDEAADLIRVGKWYMEKYPEDEAGELINANITFMDIWYATGYVYVLIGFGDSLIRERVFDALAALYEVRYEDVWERWVHWKYLLRSVA